MNSKALDVITSTANEIAQELVKQKFDMWFDERLYTIYSIWFFILFIIVVISFWIGSKYGKSFVPETVEKEKIVERVLGSEFFIADFSIEDDDSSSWGHLPFKGPFFYSPVEYQQIKAFITREYRLRSSAKIKIHDVKPAENRIEYQVQHKDTSEGVKNDQ